jgi:hypothetical protein
MILLTSQNGDHFFAGPIRGKISALAAKAWLSYWCHDEGLGIVLIARNSNTLQIVLQK